MTRENRFEGIQGIERLKEYADTLFERVAEILENETQRIADVRILSEYRQAVSILARLEMKHGEQIDEGRFQRAVLAAIEEVDEATAAAIIRKLQTLEDDWEDQEDADPWEDERESG